MSACSHNRTLALQHIGELQTYESSSSSALASEGFFPPSNQRTDHVVASEMGLSGNRAARVRGVGRGHCAARVASGDGLLLRGLQPRAPLPNYFGSIRLSDFSCTGRAAGNSCATERKSVENVFQSGFDPGDHFNASKCAPIKARIWDSSLPESYVIVLAPPEIVVLKSKAMALF